MHAFRVKSTGTTYFVPYKCGFSTFYNARTRGLVEWLPRPLHVHNAPSAVVLVRDPFLRVESFFHDKLRGAVNPEKVQICQQIMLRALGLPADDPTPLLEVSFSAFVARLLWILHQSDRDGHLHPIFAEDWRLGIPHTLCLDAEEDSRRLLDLLEVDTPMNQTERRESTSYGFFTRSMIRACYHRDFAEIRRRTGRDYLGSTPGYAGAR